MQSGISNYYCLFIILLLGYACSDGHSQETHSQAAETDAKLSDEALLDTLQKQTLRYFWDAAEPVSGMACERIHSDGIYPQNDQNVVTSGGSGFGVMGIIAGIDRGFIDRSAGVAHLHKIMHFLETADRFHGAWPHWWYGDTGKVKAFSKYDDGGDLVETSFMAQALLCTRQYFKEGNENERALAAKADQLWKEIEWNWYQGPEKDNIIYWHWSPNHDWKMNFRITGYNECMITYILGVCSPTYPIPVEAFHEGWAKNGDIVGGTSKYGHKLDFTHIGAKEYGGPLFWAHYSYLGLDPRKLSDQYTNYWDHNYNHTQINRQYCIENPHDYKGYGDNCWGITSSYSMKGYASHKPERDLGVIAPTAALSSFPYTPEESMKVLRHLYEDMHDKVIGPYGPYDAFSEEHDWYLKRNLAIDQGPILVMVENYRSGLLWKLFMSCPEVQEGLTKLGFSY